MQWQQQEQVERPGGSRAVYTLVTRPAIPHWGQNPVIFRFQHNEPLSQQVPCWPREEKHKESIQEAIGNTDSQQRHKLSTAQHQILRKTGYKSVL
ncbi:hypothetical protein E2C01_002234 [Portunus trituberculatus]|uniref:Uncharacterized protein n=1 Tax=Portunus trituberculatus TaxID=210409 RepID=A0A5B7CKH9_PORTR|nr:hypothetical protein [Portunus trituberculatus]